MNKKTTLTAEQYIYLADKHGFVSREISRIKRRFGSCSVVRHAETIRKAAESRFHA